MAEVNVQLTNYQIEALTETSVKEVLLLGGIGSGKTFTGALWMLNQVIAYPQSKHMICANTFTQLMNASVHTFTSMLDEYGIAYKSVLSGAKKYIQIGKTIIYLYSLEKYDNIRGIEVGSIWIDEAAFAKKEAYNVVKGRLRDIKGSRKIFMSTSPNSFNWVYDKFNGKDGDNATQRLRLVKALTKENLFLPDGYYDDLLEEYGGEDSPLARQELFGEFVALTGGSIYWAFDRAKHHNKECVLDKRYPVYVGMDFNIEEMNAVLVQYIRGKFYVCERIKLDNYNANTYDMAEHLVTNYQSKGFNLQIIPDSTGSSRKTSAIAGQSDHKILTDAGLTVLKTKNPLIRNRQNNMNIKMKKMQLFINPKLDNLTKEIETLNNRDKEGDVSHAAVSVGYVLWYLDPLKRVIQKRASRSVNL